MSRQLYTARRGADASPVQVLGVALGDYFAHTLSIDDVEQSRLEAKPKAVTHIPTGLACYSTDNRNEARRIARAIEALGVELDSTDPDKVGAAIIAAAPSPIREWLAKVAANTDAEPKPGFVARLLASPQWRGSVVTYEDRELAERWGQCYGLPCQEKHTQVTISRRGRSHAVLRHFETVRCARLTHLSGAVAYVRADAP